MKKKLLLIVSMCLCILGMTACEKTDPTTADYYGQSYQDLQSAAESTIGTLASLSDEDKQNYLENGQDLVVNMITRWDEAADGIGAYVGLGDFTITQSGKTLTVTQEVQFEDRPVTVDFVYACNKLDNTMTIDDVNINQVQTLGEKMSNAGMNTIMGIGTVFVILIMISLIIYAFKLIPYFTEKKKAAAKPATEEKAAVVEQIAKKEQLQDDTELIAVIAAAIAAAAGTSTDDFVVRSIKRR